MLILALFGSFYRLLPTPFFDVVTTTYFSLPPIFNRTSTRSTAIIKYMNKKEQWWDTKHDRYASEDWISKPTIFARWVIAYLPKNGRLLDVAAGHGQDSVYFARQGFSVIATDFSEKAIQYINKNITPDIKGKITTQKVDLSKKLPFEDNMFDIVYGHLAVHYFTNKITDKVFKELKRILKPGGIIALLVNSTKDPEYETGRKIEEDYHRGILNIFSLLIICD